MGKWAFGYSSDEQASLLWNNIPLDSDIVVTHTPPKYHCDQRKDRVPAGCEALRELLWKVRPLLHICGHVHEGRGVDRVRWNPESYGEPSVEKWEDPGKSNKKLSVVELSAKGLHPLDSRKGDGDSTTSSKVSTTSQNSLHPSNRTVFTPGKF
jgi:hypothetical protein